MALVPVGPNVPSDVMAPLVSHEDAILELQQPSRPTSFVIVATIAGLPDATEWAGCCLLCTENNSLVCSTRVAGTWTWLRADGSAL